ncbi:zinc-binding dehydrogenase, partial [Vibrio cholerae O1]|uniref:zinc-binding dehydrogenase n=1 Tax=Vibrio cholerae TaxID=666 RepID=UPI001C1047C1
DMWDAGVGRIAEMLAELALLFGAGDCAPLPTTAWDVADAREAFRYVSQARHVGKVVLTIAPEPGPDDLVVVTGGLGGL